MKHHILLENLKDYGFENDSIINELDKYLTDGNYLTDWYDQDIVNEKSDFLLELTRKIKSEDPFDIGLWLYRECNIHPDFRLLEYFYSLK